jgi:hypothetical protein
MFLKKTIPSVLFATLVLPLAAFGQRGEGPLNAAPPAGITPDQIMQRFAAKESEFKREWEKYTYRQDVKAQTIDGDTVDGEYHQVSDLVFNDQGKRIEHVVFAPQSTLQRIEMTQEDFDDIQNRYPFALTSEELQQYNIQYVGQQREDELNTYVFDVSPKQYEKGKRYFKGRLWVDQQDFQIVKTNGKPVGYARKRGSDEQLFPNFETYYEEIDGHNWFPTFSRADQDLHFKSGDVHIRIIVRYTNYRRFGSDVKITYEGQDITKDGQDKSKNPK